MVLVSTGICYYFVPIVVIFGEPVHGFGEPRKDILCNCEYSSLVNRSRWF